MITSTISKWCLAAVCAFFPAAVLMAQEPAAQAPAATPAAQAPAAKPAPITGHEVSAADIGKANNPLADMNALDFQNYYVPSMYGVPNVNSNTMDLRGVIVSGRQIIRATLPFQSTPVGQEQNKSGLGDFSVFDAIVLTPKTSETQFAVGPLLTAPTATNTALGQGKWQLGAAAVAIHPLAAGSIVGALVTWQHSVAGDQDRPTAHASSLQPLAIFSIGGGYYYASRATMVFDFYNNRYLVPIGTGVGKVFKVGHTVMNAWVEPQFTVYHKGQGLPSFQLFMGINLQWAKKKS